MRPSEVQELSMETEAGVAAALGAAAAKVVLYDGPTKLVVAVNGKTEAIEKEIEPRNDKADTVDALAMLSGDASEAWHHGNSVVLIVDGGFESHRLDRVKWTLTTTEAWEKATADRSGLTQKEAIELLAIGLREPVRKSESASKLLESVRLLKWATSDEETGQVERGKSSMGRQISSTAAGATEVPEEVTIEVPRWAEFDETFTVTLLVDLDAENRRVSIRATRDEATAAELKAQAFLHSHLEDNLPSAAIVAGTPG